MIKYVDCKYMMATTAIHKLGDISSPTPDICSIEGEDGDDYIGQWVTGLGFFNVRFPKSTTRDLTDQEIEFYSKQRYAMYGLMSGEKSYDLPSLHIK